MPPAIQIILDARAEIECEIDELRRQLEARQELLAAAARFETDESGELVVNGGERVSASRKRELVLAIMREQPDKRWTTREVRDALAERGINPDTGTAPKNLLWSLRQEGHVHAAGSGVYELSRLAKSAPERVAA